MKNFTQMIFRKVIALFLAVVFTSSLFAAEEPYSQVVYGSDITTGVLIDHADPLYATMVSNPITWPTLFTNYSVKNLIDLRLDREKLLNAPNFTYSVILNITYKKSDFSTVNRTDTLTVTYDATASTTHIDEDAITFTGGHSVKVEVTSITNTTGTDAVILESTINIERHYTFDYTNSTISGVGAHLNSEGDVEFYWPPFSGAEEYDLEWVFVNNYGATGTSRPSSELTYDFDHNSTRITTPANYWTISNVFEEGYLLYRVRPIGRKGTNYTTRYEGKWSSTSSNGAVSGYADTLLISSALESDKFNWVYQAGYAEKGKKTETIAYMDGLGVNRQSQAKNNTENKAIVQESYLDYSGRPAVTALPAPDTTNLLDYKTKFNKNYAGNHYSRADFDRDTTFCGNTTHPMDTTSGAGMYYSSNNPDQADFQAYVPNAKGYPLMRVEYLPDNTGRIKSQRIAGALDTTGAGITTKFRYGTPEPSQISGILGTDAGYANKYQRNLVEDPNGQVSATYVDLSGRVVASSLIGASPSGIDALASNTGPYAASDTILSGLDNQTYGSNGYSINYDQTFSVDVNGIHSFTYSFTPGQYSDTCFMANVCFDCSYDLHIEINRVDYDSICFGDSAQVYVYNTIINDTLNDSCSSITNFLLDSANFNVYLEKGEYVISKVLTVRDTGLTYYTQSFLQYDTCLMTYQDFYNAELANADFTGCNLTPEGEGCLATLGTRMDYILNNPTVPNAGAVYDSLFAACKDTVSVMYYPCTTYRNAMLADFYPGGQYAQFEIDTNGVYSSSDTLSIFNPSNYLGVYFQNSGIYYTDAIGDTSYIFNQYDSLVYPTDTSISLEVFIQNFQTSWADSLLRYHPEYCYLEYCENGDGKGDNVTTVYNYDTGFLNELHYSGADTSDYFNPLNMTTAEGAPSIWVPATNTDPFFSSSSGSAFLTSAKSRMTNFTIIYSDTLTIWEAAYWMTSCSTVDSAGLPTCISNISNISTDYCIQDAYWRNFQQLYWLLEQAYYSRASARYAIEYGCYNGCIGIADFDSTLNNFDCYTHINKAPYCSLPNNYYKAYRDAAQPCYYATSGLYSNKISHFPNDFTDPFSGLTWTQIGDTVNIMINSVLNSTCDTVCVTQAEGWMDMLIGCASSPTTWQPGNALYDSLLYELTELCVLGCQASGTGGTLTLPTGTTTHNGNSSMDDILGYHLSTGWETYECTSLLISDATNYDDSLYLHQYDTLDACGCNAFMSIRNSFDSIVLPPNVNTLEDLFFLTYSISIPNLQPYLCTCDAAWSYNTGSWTPGATWNAQSQDSLNASGISIPLDLTCVECKTCAQIEALNTSLLTRIPNVDTTENYERILGNYINRNTHFNLTGEDYADFLDTCGGDTTNVVFCETTREGEDFVALLNNLLHIDKFLTVSPAYTDLTGNPYYYNSILPQVHNDISFVQYSSNYGTNDTLITLTIGNGTNSCTSTLWFPSNSGYNLQWQYLGGLQNIRPNESTCGVTSSGEFIVDGLFYVGGQELVITLTGTSSCYTIGDCSCNHLEICNTVDRIPYEPNQCIDQIYQSIADQAASSYGSYMENEIANFQQNFINQCMSAVPTELMTMYHSVQEYHYTLFYYDQAGNLVQTVPPKGVEADSTFNWALVSSNLNSHTTYTPSYRLKTEYRYNSFNQLTKQNTPDGGETTYWYDYAGRIAASQNAKQADSSYYSYTKYDTYGRIIEAGQVYTTTALTESTVKNSTLLESWINGGTRYEVTRSYYDESLSVTVAAMFDNGQNNLRLRIGTVAYYDTYSGTDTVYNHATHYSYDRHGNVTEVIQDFPDLDYMNQNDKHTQYEYELISGNVTQVDYQKNRVDAYSHRYEYDADNRLDKVYTSEQGTIWDQDAHYHYYVHGPLARTEIGDWEVQGTDYAYTINGWLKAVNGNILDADTEMGTDGSNHTPYHSTLTAAHNLVGKDVYGFSLGYYSSGYEDYDPIKGSRSGFYNSLSNISTSGSGFTDNLGNNLYNGNIRHMATALLDNNEAEINKIANFYSYDQLNRITKMKSYLGSTYATASSTGDYNTAYSYDANGNLKTLLRNAYGTNQSMDNFTYNYANEWNNNQLDHVHDPIDSTFWGVDIDNQSSGNYAYSQIGELIRDDSAYITQIQWRWSDSKVSKIKRTNSKDQVSFKYDAFGNRVIKIVKPTDPYGNTLSADQWTVSVYARDAAGNVMAVYDYSLGASAYTLSEKEVTLYGSSRLGIKSMNKTVATYTGSGTVTDTSGYPQRKMGNKYYQLSNHLGNVLSVITDRKLATDSLTYTYTGSGTADYSYDASLPVEYYYTPGTGNYSQDATLGTDGVNDFYYADVESYSDYYPFGMEMPGRNGNTSGYRYGFQGQEKDDEIKGTGNSVNFRYRMQDPRLGRFFAVDPLTAKYPYNSPYNFSENRVIDCIELEGLELVDADAAKIEFINGMVKLRVVNLSGASQRAIYQNAHKVYTDENGRQHTGIQSLILEFSLKIPKLARPANPNNPANNPSTHQVKLQEEAENGGGRWTSEEIREYQRFQRINYNGGLRGATPRGGRVAAGAIALVNLANIAVETYFVWSTASDNNAVNEQVQMVNIIFDFIVQKINDGTIPEEMQNTETISLIMNAAFSGTLPEGYKQKEGNDNFVYGNGKPGCNENLIINDQNFVNYWATVFNVWNAKRTGGSNDEKASESKAVPMFSD